MRDVYLYKIILNWSDDFVLCSPSLHVLGDTLEKTSKNIERHRHQYIIILIYCTMVAATITFDFGTGHNG